MNPALYLTDCEYCSTEYTADGTGDDIVCGGSGVNVCGECRPDHIVDCSACLSDYYSE